MPTFVKYWTFLSFILSFLITSACTKEPETISVTSISLNETSITLCEDEKYLLVATINPNNASNKKITWTSSNPLVALVDDTGKVTAIKTGTTLITVTTEDGNKEDSCQVIVLEKTYPVTGVSLDKTEYEMTEGDQMLLTASIYPENATNKNITWSSNNRDVAVVQDSKVTAISPGQATITVTTEDGKKTASCEVTVIARYYPVESISLDITSYEMTEGDEVTLTPTINPINATNKNISWISSNTSVATVENGKVMTLAPGNVIVTVITEDGNKTAECSIIVKKRIYPVTSITLDKTAYELPVGEGIALKATVYPENATNKNIMWSSSNEAVATIDNGVVIGKYPGKVTIIATTEDGKKTANCTITVVSAYYPVESITLNKTQYEISEGDEIHLYATINPNNATNKKIHWNSSNIEIVTVENGKITALNPGTTTITAITDDGAKSTNCEVVVNALPYSSAYVTLDKRSLELREGETRTITATIKQAGTENEIIIWSSSDSSIVSVYNGTLTAIKPGQVIITAKVVSSGHSMTCVVSVKKKSSGMDIEDWEDGSDDGGIAS